MRRFGAHRVATFALASLCFIQAVQTVQAQTAAQGRSLLSFEPAATAQAQTAGASDRGLPTFFPEDVPRRRVRVDIDLLRQGAPRLDLLTPDGRTLQARLTHFEERGGGDVLWSGRVPGASYDTISLTVHNGHVHGSYGAPGEAKHALRAGGDGLGAVASEAEAGGELEPDGHAWCEETIAPFPEGPEAVLEAFAARAAADAAAAESLSQADARPRAASASTAPAPERLALAQTAVPVAFSVSPLSVAEDAAAPVTVTVTATVAAGDTSGSDRTITIEVGDAPAMEGVATPGVDFTNVSGFSLNLLANQTSGTASFTLAPVNDASPEPHETVQVSGTLAGADVTPAEVEITDDDQHVVDILILYTPSTASIMAGVTREHPTVTIASETQGAVDYVNLVWRNNAFPARLNLVHVAAVPQGVIDNRGYGPRDYIFAMREDPDLLRLREAHDADLVFLWTWEPTTPRLPCGVAFLRSKAHTTETMAPSGIGYYNFACDPGATPWSILAHEIGHVLGALHDPANHSPDPRVPIYPYAFGHTHLSGGNELNLATIMSYGTPAETRCTRVWRGICVERGSFNTFTREPFYSTVRVQPTRRADPDANTSSPLSGPVPVGILNERENERAIRHVLHSTSTFDRHMLAAPPANLTGTASASGATVNVALTWDDVSSRETGYAVQYRVFGDGPWQTGANLASNVEGTTLTGLNPGTRYVFRVAATNSLGFVSHSYEWVVRTPGIAPPNAPGNLRVEVVRRSVGRRDIAGTVNLTWSDWSESETGFLVQYREVGAVDWTAGPTVAADGTSVEVTDLGNDVEYEFRVGAVNDHGTAWSRIVTARTEPPVPPDAPGDLVGLRLSSTTVRLSWLDNSEEDFENQEVNETAFDVHVRPFAGQEWTVVASAPPDTETAVVGGLPENSHLTFRVASVGPGGQGLSDEVSIDLTVEPPGMPVVRSWLDRDASNRIVPRFEITVEPSNGAEFYMATRSVGVWSRYTTRELTQATPFRAEARNGGGRRVSEDFHLGPTPVPPRRPSGLSATQAGPTSVRFSWTDNATDELWYRVSLSRGGAPAIVYGVYPAGTSEVTLVGLRPGSYELELDTANAAGAISPSATTFTLPVPDPLPPNPATNLAAAFGSATTEIDLTWTDNSSDETGFRVGVRAEDGAWTFTDVAAGTTSHTATGLTPNTLYDFRILAVSSAGSFESDLVSFDLHPTPRAPSELRAQANGSTSAVLDWLDNASNETGFRVESRQGTAAWGAAVSNLPANTRTWTATGLSPGASYDFRVVAINNAGESTSGDASLTMPPAAPTNLQASVAGATSASLTWTDNASTETSFQVEYRGKSESGWTLWAPDPAADATSVTVTGLVPNRDYEFRVFAAHGEHGLSSPSNVASAVNFPRLSEPASNVVVTFLGSDSCRVEWTDNASDETGFVVEYRLFGRDAWVSGATTAANTTTATLTGLLPSRTYRFRVLAANANGSRPSFQVEVTSPPAAPSDLTLEPRLPTVNLVDLAWRNNAIDQIGWRVENRVDGGTWISLGVVDHGPSANISGLTPLQRNEFRVRAVNANGDSSPSNVVAYTTPGPPAAPSGLTVQASGSTGVLLAWTDESDDEGGFDVEYRAQGAGAWTLAGSVAADVTSTAATGLAASTAYDFRVSARNASGATASGTASLTMPPAAPSGLAATQPTATSAALTWTDNSSDETGFKVQSSDGSAWTDQPAAGAGATSATVSGLTSGTSYEFRVLATNGNGDSTPSNVAHVGSALAPPAPSGVAATAAGSTRVLVTWTDASTNETGFEVAHRIGAGAWTVAQTAAADAESATVTGLSPSTTYDVRVAATNANGSNAGNVVSLTMPPAAPTGLAASAASANSVGLTWTDASSDEAGFRIEYRRPAAAAWTAFGTVAAVNATSATVTGLTGGTAYEFRVVATHGTNGASDPSNVASATTFGTRRPTGLRAVATDSTSVSLTWRDESTDETSFTVQRRTGGGAWTEVVELQPNLESAALEGFAASTAYDLRVLAVGPGGSTPSDHVSLTMPPAPPKNLSAATASSTSATLTWTDASTDETGFYVEYTGPDPDAPGTTARFRLTQDLPAGSTSATATGLVAGGDYVFVAYARHAANGLSSPSNEAPLSMLGAPAAPSGVSATAMGSTQVDVTWTDNSSNETGFRVEYRSGPVNWTNGPTVSAGAGSASVSGLRPSRGYEFRVSATNAQGATPSPSANLVMPPAPPRIVGAASEGATSVGVYWQDQSPDETSFVIEYRQTASSTWTVWSTEAPANATSAIVTGLQRGVSYQFRVFAKHVRNGLSTPSAAETLNSLGVPAAPSDLVVTAQGSTRVALTWVDNSTDEVAFDVEQRTGSNPWATAVSTAADANWASVTGLTPGQAYDFRVAARNANGVEYSSAVTVNMPPLPPTGLSVAEVSPTSARLTWTDASTRETGFQVEYRAVGEESWTTWGTSAAANATSITVTGLTAGVGYEFRVRAKGSGGSLSDPSNVATLAPLGAPAAPSGFTVVATGSTGVTATWVDNSSNESVFRVERRLSGAEDWTEAALANRDATTVAVPRLVASTAYEFRVLAWNEHGGAPSNVVALTTPPAPPTGLAATVASPTSVTLTWTDASSDETGFVAEYRLAKAKDWTAFATEAAADATSLVVTGLSPGKAYEFRVRARHATNGLGSPSDVVAVETLGGPAAPTNVSVTASGSTSVVLTWADNATDETGFAVERRIGRGAWATVAEVGANVLTATVDGLAPSTTYEFRVAATNAHGAVPGEAVSLTMPPAAPVGLTAAAATSTSVRLTWTDASSDETGFVAEYRAGGGSNWSAFGTKAAADATAVTVTGLTSGTTYDFRVFAESANGLSSPSGVARVASGGAPAAASAVTTAPAGSTSVLVTWTDNSTDETGFQVQYRIGSGGWTTGAAVAASVTRVEVKGLEPSTTYEFRVVALNANGEAASAAVSRTTPPAAPGALAANRTSGARVKLTWVDRSSDETGFVVEHKAENERGWTVIPPEVLAGSTSFRVSGLSKRNNYAFRVFAKHATNGLSSPSRVVHVGPFGAPAAPSGVVATASGASTVVVSWTDNASDETGFQVEYRVARGGVPWTTFSTAARDATSATVTGLLAETTYEFRVGAANDKGVSWSAVATARTSADTVPAAPTNLAVDMIGPTRAELTWTDVATNETAYEVSFEGPTFYEMVYSVYPAGQEAATLTGLMEGPHEVWVRAVNGAGRSEPATLEFTEPKQRPKPPKEAEKLTATLTGPITVELTWQDKAKDETSYLAAVRPEDGAWSYARSDPDSTSGTFHGLVRNRKYYARVQAYHEENGGLDNPDEWVEFNTFAEPRAVSGFTVTPAGSTTVTLDWVDESSEETGYEVQIRGAESGWVTETTVAADAEQATLAGLEASAVYRFRVRTVTADGSANSDAVRLTMPPPPPGGLLARPLSATGAGLSWTDESSDETGFVAEYRTVGSPAWTRFGAEAGADETTLPVTGLTSGASYEFRVFARHSVNGLSSPSNVAALDQVGAPAAPGGVSVVAAGMTSAEVSWTDKSSDETSFQVEHRTGGGAWTATTAAADAEAATVTGISAGTAYDFRVVALNDHGSRASAIVSLTMPSAPAASCTASSVAVTATSPTNASALAADCAFLLDSKSTLEGSAPTKALNWSATLSMSSWDGITIASDRVSQILLGAEWGLSGAFPASLAPLSGLQSLRITRGQLTGGLPTLPGSLRNLDLSQNRLSGTLPDFNGLSNLIEIRLNQNGFTGSVPTAARLPSTLTHLEFVDNALSGAIPDLSRLGSLVQLDLTGNDLTGGIPALPASLVALRLTDNDLNGAIGDLRGMTALRHLHLNDNGFSGAVPGNLPTGLQQLYIRNNALDGSTFPDLSSLSSLSDVRLDRNALTGSVPPDDLLPPNLRILLLYNNSLSGAIPDLSDLSSLIYLYLQSNELTGAIPAGTTLPPNLQRLVLRSNALSGSIPTTLPTSLRMLHLGGNDLANAIPSQLDGLTALTELSLCDNDLTGALPSTLETKRTANPATLTVFSCAYIEDAAATEGTPVEFTVTHDTFPVLGSAAAADLALSWETADDTATSADYTGTAGTPGSVTIAGNTDTATTSSTATISVATTEDTAVEGNEAFTVSVSLPDPLPSGLNVLATEASAVGTIEDDDTAANPTVELSVTAGGAVTEGGTLTLTATLSAAPSANVSVPIQRVAANSTAAAGDYSLSPASITVASGNRTGTATLTAATDTADEQDEPLRLALGTVSGHDHGSAAHVDIVITDNTATTVTLSVEDAQATEGTPTATAGIRLTLGRGLVAGEALAVPLTFTGGTAGTDFTLALSGSPTGVTFASSTSTVTFTGPQSGTTATTADLTLTPEDDDDANDRTVTVSIGTPTPTNLDGGASASRSDNGQITIADDETERLVFSRTTVSVTEGSAETYTVKLGSAPSSSVTVSVSGHGSTDLKVDTDSGTDGDQTSLTFTTSNWNNAQTVTVTAAEDDDASNETAITLSHSASGGGYGSVTGNVTVNITDNDDPKIDLSVNNSGAVTEAGTLTITAAVSQAPAGSSLAIPVQRVSANSTAVAADFSLNGTPAGTITVADGATTGSITLTATNDSADEAAETLRLELGTLPSGYERGATPLVDIVITDNDATTVTLAVPDGQATEGNSSATAGIRLTLGRGLVSGEALAVPLTFSGGTAGTDFTLALSGSPTGVTFASGTSTVTFTGPQSGATATEANVTLTPADDDDANDRTVTVSTGTLTATSLDGGASASRTGNGEITIADDETERLVFSRTTVPVAEGSEATYTVRLATAPTSDVTVTVSGHSSTDLSVDTDSGTNGNQTTLTFTTSTWNSAQTVTVTAAEDDDTTNETAITLAHAASGGGYGSVTGNVTVNITDNDEPKIDLSVNNSGAVTEAGTLTITAAVSQAPAGSSLAIPVQRVSANSTAVAADFSLNGTPAGTITVADGATTGSITLTATDDSADEVDETLRLELGTLPTGYARGATPQVDIVITDNDVTTVTLSVPDGQATEGNSSATAGIRLTLGRGLVAGEALAVPLTFSGGTAGTDFTLALSGSPTGVTFASGTSTVTFTGPQSGATATTANLTLTPEDDDDANDRTVTVSTGTPTPTNLAGGASGSGSGQITISDDETQRLVFSRTTVPVTEGSEATYTVRLATAPTSNVTVTVSGHSSTDLSVDTDSGTGGDQTTLTFTTSTWNNAQTVTVTAGEDDDAANEAAITLSHSASGGGYGSVSGNVTVNITDNDALGLTFSSTAVSVTEASEATYTVRLATAPTSNVTVTVSGQSGTDLSVDTDSGTGGDQTTLTFTTSTWNSAQTVTVTAAEDDDTSNETAITLAHAASGGGYNGVSGNVTVNITDDDNPLVNLSVNNSGAVTEAGTLTITAEVSQAPSGKSLAIPVQRVAANSTAVAADFSLNGTPAGTITVADGATTGAITLTATDDAADEVAETLRLELGTLPTGYARGATPQVDIVITDNDATTVTLSTPDTEATEGTVAATAGIRLTLGRGLVAGEALAVPLTFSGGTAGTDFTLALSGSPTGVTFASGTSTVTFTGPQSGTTATTANVTLTPADDDDANDRTVTVSIGTPTPTNLDGGTSASRTGNGEITISDDETKRLVFSRTTVPVTEGSEATYTVRLGTAPTSSVEVTVSGHGSTDLTVDTDSGTNGNQTSLTFTTSTWNSAQTVTVTAAEDNDTANEAAITLAHAASGGGYGSVTGNVTVNITDDDDPPTAPSAPTGVTVSATGSTSVSVRWTDASSDETSFRVEYRTGSNSWTTGTTTVADATSATVGGLSASTSYDFRVASVNSVGSSESSAVSLTMPPAAPSGLAASASSPGSVALSWTDNASDETGFLVEYRAAGDLDWTQFATRADANATSLVVTGLTSGTAYRFRVSATSANGLSSPSNEAFVGAAAVPLPPTDVTVSATGSTSVSVTWTDASTDEAGFRVEYRTGSDSWATGATTLADATSATVGGLAPSTAYDVRVVSVNANGSSESASSSLVMPPAAVSDLSGSAVDAVTVTLQWTDNASDATSFVVEYRAARTEDWTVFPAETPAGSTTTSVTGLAAGTSHDFRVYAKHGTNGLASPSGVIRVGAFRAPAPPTNVAAAPAGGSAVRLTWTDTSDDETGFEIEYREANPGVWRKFETEAPADAESIVVTGLAADTSYEFRVLAKSAAGLSSPSPVSAATTGSGGTVEPPPPTGPPAPPPNRAPFFDPATPLEFTVVEGTTGAVGSPVAASDPDGDALSYLLRGEGAGAFAVNNETGQILVRRGVTLDASVRSSYAFSVIASDGALSASREVTVEVVEPRLPGSSPIGRLPDPPTELAATLLTSEVVVLTWLDRADDESGFEVHFREGTGGWEQVRSLPANVETATVEELAGGIEYEFVVLAVNRYGRTASEVVAIELSLAPPTHLDAVPLGETSARVVWRDNATVETGYEVQLRRAAANGADGDADDAGDADGEGGSDGEGGAATGWTAVATVGANSAAAVLEGLAPGASYRFRVAALGQGGTALSGTARFTLAEPPLDGANTNCVPTGNVATLADGYDVRMCVEMPSGAQVDASNYHLESTASGLLYFFDRDNVEVLVKVLDGCAINGHRWVFIAPVTTLAFHLEVVERSTGNVFTHRNPRSVTAATVSDTTAFACDPAAAAATVATGLTVGAAGGAVADQEFRAADGSDAGRVVLAASETPVCEPDGPGIELESGHRIDMCFATPDGGVLGANDWGLAPRSAALLHFFDRENAEVLVKVLDGCAVNGHHWVFAAPATDLAFHLVVTAPDGQRWTHRNSAGQTAEPRSDTAAFSCR